MNLVPRSLAWRLIVSLTLIVAALEGISGSIAVRQQEKQLHETMVLGADQLSQSIVSATWHAMLEDQRASAYEVMKTIARKQGISRIQIFNKEGRVMFSTAPGGPSQVDKKAEACYVCHASQQPLVRVDVPSRARVFRAPDGSRRLAIVTPIYNELACAAAECHAHPEPRTVLGVLDVALDLAPVDRELREIKWRAVRSGAIHVLVLAVFLVFFTRGFVARPIRRLIAATRDLGVMQVDRPVPTDAPGEVGELARSFESMRHRLRAAVDELNEFTQGLEEKVESRTEELKAANLKLMQSDRLASLGQLSASVAHEINNPLSGVLNLSMLMQRIVTEDGIPPARVPEFRRYLAQVVNETSRVGRIVSDLLAFSRRGKPQRTRVDVNGVVSQTVSLVGHKLKLMSVEPVQELAVGLPLVLCDGSQLQQVLLNLVMNGAEATRHKKGGTVWVRTRTGPRPDTVAIEVQDTGDGIAPEQMKKLFQPFYTTKDDVKGVGLGLAVVYGIVQAHGGDIEVVGNPGAGALFRVVLPVTDEARRVEGDEAAAAVPGAA